MQEEKADYLYREFCESLRRYNDRQDEPRLNWLILKLKSQLNCAPRKTQKEIKMQPVTNKPKNVPRLRATLPVCLPISHHHRYLRNKYNQESLLTCVKNINLPYGDNSNHILDKALNLKIKKIATLRDVSVQVPHENNLTSHKLDINVIPLLSAEKSTQTDEVTVIVYGNDISLLRMVKNFNFTANDLERFHQSVIEENNNTSEFEDRNQVPDIPEPTIQNASLPFNRQLMNCNSWFDFLNPYEKAQLLSDLNKLVLSALRSGISLVPEIGNDKSSLDVALIKLSANLVEEFHYMITHYLENNTSKQSSIEIIELFDSDDEADSSKKRPAQTDSTEQINATKSLRPDTQQYLQNIEEVQNQNNEQEMQNQLTVSDNLTQNNVTQNNVENYIHNQIVPYASQTLQRSPAIENRMLPVQTLENVPVNEGHSHISMYQNAPTYTQAEPHRTTVLRDFRMTSVPIRPAANSNSRPNYHSSCSGQPSESQFFYSTYNKPQIQNNRKQQKARTFRFQNTQQPFRPHFRNTMTPNRQFPNVIQQNPQYNTSQNMYENNYPYNYRNSYSADYRPW